MDTAGTTTTRIRQVIRDAWESAGLTQTEVADAVQIPRATFGRYINGVGRRTFDLAELERIADLLGVTVTDIATKAEAA
jgi:transcriptional regulator with XRE-family HTH domain